MCTSTSVISTPGNRCCTLAFRLHTPSSIFVILNFKCAHLKFLVYGRKQTDRQTYIHTHVCNAVTLVWGSLRLTPISLWWGVIASTIIISLWHTFLCQHSLWLFSFQIQSLEFSRQSDLPARHSSQTSAMGGMTRVDADNDLRCFSLLMLPLMTVPWLLPSSLAA